MRLLANLNLYNLLRFLEYYQMDLGFALGLGATINLFKELYLDFGLRLESVPVTMIFCVTEKAGEIKILRNKFIINALINVNFINIRFIYFLN